MLLEQLTMQMIAFDRADPKRIQHFLKVHSFSRTIAVLEGLSEQQRLITEAAALVHDIGIPVCEEKYGDCSGKLQEKEGPALAEQMLTKLSFDRPVVERVCYLVGHHHTYSAIDGMDYQILVEADLLVNLYEEAAGAKAVEAALKRVFKTPSGTAICKTMFGIVDDNHL